jgi:hypothetical protein
MAVHTNAVEQQRTMKCHVGECGAGGWEMSGNCLCSLAAGRGSRLSTCSQDLTQCQSPDHSLQIPQLSQLGWSGTVMSCKWVTANKIGSPSAFGVIDISMNWNVWCKTPILSEYPGMKKADFLQVCSRVCLGAMQATIYIYT